MIKLTPLELLLYPVLGYRPPSIVGSYAYILPIPERVVMYPSTMELMLLSQYVK